MRRFFFNWWTLTILAAVLVALLLAFGLPIVVLALRPWWARLLLVAAVAFVWVIFALVHVLRRRQASDAIAEELAKPETAGDEEAKLLAERMSGALAGLKKASGDKRDYLYSRPWYVIIGPPGAGKTTALLNSGLRFPFSEQALKGVGGTRNLDFWFADEAVLVDTAGRYTTQDSDTATDAKAWDSFLGLLRKNRPLQPINGVLIAVGLDELLRADRVAIDAHASAIRRRLAELRSTLEVAAPVYVLFTKADLLAGFVEFFEDLDVEGRRAVLGATLPWQKSPSADLLADEFDTLVQSLADRTSKRLQDDPDARRRGLILGFLPQVEALRPRVLRFLEGAFLAERGQREPLRGFYFTSGVQEGAPLDRILGGVAQIYDQPRIARDRQGRAYFLNRLLGEVVFPEAGLVQTEPRARARRTAQQMAGFAAIGLVSLLTLVLWGVSFANNQKFETDLMRSAGDAQRQLHDSTIDLAQYRDSDPNIDQALPVLATLRNLPRGYQAQLKGGRPLFWTFGLYQDGLAERARQTYLAALRRIMLPRVLVRLENVLNQNQTQPLDEYEPLKTYMMLGGLHAMDAKSVGAWIKGDWTSGQFPGDDNAQVRQQLGAHLDAMLADRDLESAWPNNTAPLNGALIRTAQTVVQSLSLGDRAYAILKQNGVNAGQPWTAGTVLGGGDAPAFANGQAVLGLQVPYFYTREGYEKAYLPGLATVEQDLKNDLWVLGQDASTTSILSQLAGIRPGVAGHYAQDYIAAWEKVIAALQPAGYLNDPVALGAFTKTPSPLKVILGQVTQNTIFTAGASGVAQNLLQQKINSMTSGLAGQVANAPPGADAAGQITQHFQALQAYVGDGKAAAPIDTFVTAVLNAANANNSATASNTLGGIGGTANTGALAQALGALQTAGAGAPAQLKGFVASAAKGGTAAAATTTQNTVSTDYAQNLAPPCQSLVQNYPFVAGSMADARIEDMQRVFGVSALFDNFTHNELGKLLDQSGPVWRWQANNPVSGSLDPLSAEQLQRATQLTTLLAAGQQFTIAPVLPFGGDITGAEFGAGGATIRFDSAAPGPRTVTWSPSASSADVILFAGTTPKLEISPSGPWALFRLMDQARKQNAGPTSFMATFGQGTETATFKISLPSEQNPFSRGGLWSFRCPTKL